MPRTEYRRTVITPTLRFMIAGLVLSCTTTLSAQDSATEAEDSMSERPRRVRPDVGDVDQNPRHGGRFDGRRGGMADRLLGRGDGGESRGRGIPRKISEEDFKRMIEIGKRISPEMSAALEKQWVENREEAM
jgi:ABC-type phosphonate transport system ATPase subunit